MDTVIVDLGSDVNFILKKTQEMMGKPNLIQSPIQLRLEKQHKIVPIGRMTWVGVSIDGVCNLVDFEVIDIVDRSTPYPILLRLDCAF